MSRTLSTPWVHAVVASPLGRFVSGIPAVGWVSRALPRILATSRARATADVTADAGVEAFLDALGNPAVDAGTRRSLDDALATHRERLAARERAEARWEAAFWRDRDVSSDALVDLEEERRAAAAAWAQPGRLFDPLVREGHVDPVGYDLPDPDDAESEWADAIDDPASVYAAPEQTPSVEESRRVLGPDTVEYLVRFRSPSRFVDDAAYAHVYEPLEAGDALPTFVYGSGLGTMYDQLSYWPEEAYLGRTLAPRGYRVVLVESPWHGRRERPGAYSGEPYLAGPPVTLFQLYAAQAAETAVLVDWARSRGAPAVGVGGVSLGGIVALLVAGFSGRWPERFRPDVAAPVAMVAAADRLLVESDLVALLEMDDALADAGWTPERLARFRPLLAPPDEPGVPPEHVYAVAGLRDEIAPYRGVRALLDEWGVPASNVTERTTGHVGVLLGLMAGSSYQNTVAGALDRVVQRDALAE